MLRLGYIVFDKTLRRSEMCPLSLCCDIAVASHTDVEVLYIFCLFAQCCEVTRSVTESWSGLTYLAAIVCFNLFPVQKLLYGQV